MADITVSAPIHTFMQATTQATMRDALGDVRTPNPMGALAISTAPGAWNTKSISVDSTFTFSSTPATAETFFSLYLINTDTVPHLITIPSSFDVNGQATITTFYIGAGGEESLTFRYDGSGYKVFGVPQLGGIRWNSQVAAYTTTIADANATIYHPASDNNARAFTIAANASVPYPLGTAITFVNDINTVTIPITSDTLVLAGTAGATTGTRTLAIGGIATAIKKTSTSWLISGTGLT
jgi:hypothetical protein